MAYKEHKITKVWYTIGEVAEAADVATSAVRYWQSEGLIKIRKHFRYNHKGNREFSTEGFLHVTMLSILLGDVGMTVEGVRKAIELGYAGEIIHIYTYIKYTLILFPIYYVNNILILN